MFHPVVERQRVFYAKIFCVKNNLALILILSGFISAICISSFFTLGFSFFLFLIFLSIVFFVFRKFFVLDLQEKRKIVLLIAFFLSFACGVLRYEIKDSTHLDENLQENIGQKVLISGIIVDEPKNKESGVSLVVDFKNMIAGSSSLAVFGRGIVSTSLHSEFHYGDAVNISGKLEKPENFATDESGTKEFDYISYLAKDDIFYQIDFAQVSFLSSGNGNFLKELLFKIKNMFTENINTVIQEPESSLLSGILLGAKNSMDKDTSQMFRVVGLSHIVALSGYNITVVSDAIIKFFSFLPKTAGLSFGVIGIILFVIMSGSSSTAVRAGIMSLVVILAHITKRDYQIGRALIIAAFVMILVNPKILVFDISFQLSFLATLAIVYVAPIFKRKLHFVTERFALRDTIASTVSAQILVLPLILYKMGMLSIVALPVNVLVLALIPATMFFGFMTGALGFLWTPLSLPCAWISYMLLAYIIKISEIFAWLPFSSVMISWFSVFFMIVSYIIIGIWFWHERKNYAKN